MIHLLLLCCAASLLAVAGGVRIAFVSVPLHVKDLIPAAALLADMGHSVTIASSSDDAGTITNLDDKCKVRLASTHHLALPPPITDIVSP